MIKVLLDANFLIYCAKEKIDYKEQIFNLLSDGVELAVPLQVVYELKKVEKSAKKYSDKQAAKLALLLLKSNEVKEILVKGKNGDQAILNLQKGNFVATHDSALKNKVDKALVIVGKRKIEIV